VDGISDSGADAGGVSLFLAESDVFMIW